MYQVVCYLCESSDYAVIFPSKDCEVELTEKHIAARQGSINQQYLSNWVRCNRCGLVYANPVPEETILEKLYTISNQSGYYDEEVNVADTYECYLRRHSRYIQKKRMALDIGTGNGFFLRRLLALGFEHVLGVEPSVLAYSKATPDIRSFIINKTFAEEDFMPKSIDCITCFQTLEHFYYPNRVIEAFSRLLSPGGLVYCVAHNFDAFGVRLLGRRHPIVNAGHLTLFTSKTLAAIFSKYLEVLDVFNIGNRYSLRYWLSLLPINSILKNGILSVCASIKIDKWPLTLSLGNIGIIARRRSSI